MMKMVVSGFAALSGFAILALTIFVPQIYWEMNELQVEVVGVVESFKVETDSLWIDLMDVQIKHSAPSRPLENPLLRRDKRFAKLPDWCQCDSAPQCPPGPPGPQGAPGTPGSGFF
uniref:Col_cuticle_N domain-containing protein n=1 Tax=Caenorhabditis tropicalis TaxID=1561998 RepID=A0A1I7UTU1_9PELO